jgi:cytochrome c-type biogenesis protein CcmH/NrfG
LQIYKEIAVNSQTSSKTDDKNMTSILWSSTQAYGLALITLLLGLVAGFLLHGPASAANVPPTSQATDQASPHTGMSVTPEQLKHMADMQAGPLLDKLKQDPNNPELLAQVADTYLAGHQFNTAVEYYEKSASIKPDANLLTQLANAYFYSGSPDKAIDALNRALQVDPKFANALFNLGALKWQVRGDSAGAIAAWQKLLKTNPNHPKRREVEAMIERVRQQKKAAVPAS